MFGQLTEIRLGKDKVSLHLHRIVFCMLGIVFCGVLASLVFNSSSYQNFRFSLGRFFCNPVNHTVSLVIKKWLPTRTLLHLFWIYPKLMDYLKKWDVCLWWNELVKSKMQIAPEHTQIAVFRHPFRGCLF